MNKKTFLTILSLIISVVFIFVIVIDLYSVNHIIDNTSSDFKPTIIIDAGHGGEDSGAVSTDNILEKNLNLEISLKLRDLFVYSGFEVLLTRETDIMLQSNNKNLSRKQSDLQNRVDIFNSSVDNVVISIHQNKFEQEQYSGTQVFFSQNNADSEYLASSIQTCVKSLIQKDNDREIKKAGSDIYILDNCNVPAVLVECGFLSNQEEKLRLSDDRYQSELTYCIYLGFLEYYYRNY